MIISNTKNFLAAYFNFFIDLLKFSQRNHFLKKHIKDFERKNHLINLTVSVSLIDLPVSDEKYKISAFKRRVNHPCTTSRDMYFNYCNLEWQCLGRFTRLAHPFEQSIPIGLLNTESKNNREIGSTLQLLLWYIHHCHHTR